jgi:hypothetical protein
VVLSLTLFALALLLIGARPRLGLAAALLGTGALLATALPVLGGESFGTQELQRLLTSLKPLGTILAGEHGDPRHTAGLFLLYAPIAHAAGTVEALRIQGFLFLAASFTVWVALRFRAAPGECLAVLGLLAHPVLLKNSLEVGPYAFFTAFALMLHLAVGVGDEFGRRRFGLGLFFGALLSATNQVGALLGPCLLWLSVLRQRRALGRREALLRSAAVLVVALPFWIMAVGSLLAEPPLRAAASQAPDLAWGQRALWDLARGLYLAVAHGKLGVILPATGLLAGLLVWRRRWDGLVLIGLGLGILGALVGFSGAFRVQPYYGLYAAIPLLLGLGRLVGGLGAPASRALLGLLVLGAIATDLASAGPAMARSSGRPLPAARIAEAARQSAAACPVLASATNDLLLPLLPHLEDPRRLGAPKGLTELEREGQVLAMEASGHRLPRAGLTLASFFSRHSLPPGHVDLYVKRLSELGRRGCVQVLYDRDFPVPRVHDLLERRCSRIADHGTLVLYRCAGAID